MPVHRYKEIDVKSDQLTCSKHINCGDLCTIVFVNYQILNPPQSFSSSKLYLAVNHSEIQRKQVQV